MVLENQLIVYVVLALLVAAVVSFLMTPVVKTFAYKVGAIDVPKDARRMHKVPIPRLGGLAIFIGFLVSIVLFVNIRGNQQMQSILLGAVIIVILGVVDDITPLPAMFKFVVQIVAAAIPAMNGVVIQAISNPNVFSTYMYTSSMAGCTVACNCRPSSVRNTCLCRLSATHSALNTNPFFSKFTNRLVKLALFFDTFSANACWLTPSSFHRQFIT